MQCWGGSVVAAVLWWEWDCSAGEWLCSAVGKTNTWGGSKEGVKLCCIAV